jgi:hypothetical protein
MVRKTHPTKNAEGAMDKTTNPRRSKLSRIINYILVAIGAFIAIVVCLVLIVSKFNENSIVNQTHKKADNNQIGESGPVSTRKQYKITGSDIVNRFYVVNKGHKLILSPDIPDEHGIPQKGKGLLFISRTVGIDGKTSSASPNGFVWTPRIEAIRNADLASENPFAGSNLKLSDIINNNKVIEFNNGYGINLYGAKIKDGNIIGFRSQGTYLTRDGRRLPGFLLKTEAGKVPRNPVVTVIMPESPEKE